jgi:methyl-accepting chemotaxis protein
MLPNIDLDPEGAASALDQLADDLEDAPNILSSRPELAPKALAEAEEAVTRWAIAHGAPGVCVPERPVPDELTVQRTLLFLRELASVVRYVARNIKPFGEMKNVVAELRARGDKAVQEIVELDRALTELVDDFGQVEDAMSEIQVAFGNASSNRDGDEALPQIRDAMGSVHAALEQLVASLRDIGKGVKSWIATADLSAN